MPELELVKKITPLPPPPPYPLAINNIQSLITFHCFNPFLSDYLNYTKNIPRTFSNNMELHTSSPKKRKQ